MTEDLPAPTTASASPPTAASVLDYRPNNHEARTRSS